ncbi:hypothetical protein [Daejeonella sp.]|uniref:hypothetical protein n=1 Tax=Daejeonella sp. TaxID=2805397 RepID=UPI0025C009AA|nr:hypothetical protein [Daejeonella sp.]
MLNSTKKSAVFCISEKLNISLGLKVAALENINLFVTELEPAKEMLLQYQIKGLKII